MSYNTFNKPVILFDGVCNLCNRVVIFLVAADKKKMFRYAALQSETAQTLLEDFQLDNDFIESVILVDNERIFKKSDAVFQIIKILGGYWRYFSFLRFVPKFLRDFIYELIAENRYRWFGKRDKCMIPDEKVKHLFLH